VPDKAGQATDNKTDGSLRENGLLNDTVQEIGNLPWGKATQGTYPLSRASKEDLSGPDLELR